MIDALVNQIAMAVAAKLQSQFSLILTTLKGIQSQMALDTSKLDTQDAAILAAVAALGPLIQTAITDIQSINTSSAADQAVLDNHVSKLQSAVDTLGQLQTSLSGAENPTPPPAA